MNVKNSCYLKRMLLRFIAQSRIIPQSRKVHYYKENWKNFQHSPKPEMIPFSAPPTGDRWTNDQTRKFIGVSRFAGDSRSNTQYDYCYYIDRYNAKDDIMKS